MNGCVCVLVRVRVCGCLYACVCVRACVVHKCTLIVLCVYRRRCWSLFTYFNAMTNATLLVCELNSYLDAPGLL